MSTKRPLNRRPWYAPDRLVEAHLTVLNEGGYDTDILPARLKNWLGTSGNGGDLRMLKALKIVRSILVIATIGAISLYTLYLGADPTLVAMLSLPGLAGYAGFEAADYAALAQAFREVRSDTDTEEDS